MDQALRACFAVKLKIYQILIVMIANMPKDLHRQYFVEVRLREVLQDFAWDHE
jgi:hypothetical protein